MKDEYINQYRHFWRTFEKVVKDFSKEAWTGSGYELTTPVLTAYHIIKSIKFYISDLSPVKYRCGKIVNEKRENLKKADLPAKEDIIFLINNMSGKTDNWIQNIDFTKENTEFDWTGKTNLSVVLFLLKHSQYHLGEINVLLNEYKEGKAEDHFAHSL